MRFGSAEDNSSDQRRRTGQLESQMFKRGSRRDGDGNSLDAFPENDSYASSLALWAGFVQVGVSGWGVLI